MFTYPCSVLKLLKLLIILSAFLNQTSTFRIRDTEDAVEYLSRFGYLDKSKSIDQLSRNEVKQALKEFQGMSHIPQVGKITRQTLNKMNSPRCGNKDAPISEDEENNNIVTPRQSVRRKRSVEGQKWDKRQLTYKILKFPSNTMLNPRTVQREFDHAFKYWEKVTNIRFKKITTGKADIRIKFLRGAHGDAESFDGPGKSLAHGFRPKLSAVHMDDQEMWSTATKIKKRHFDIRTVAVHEIGHSLGLNHSNSSKAIMYFQYRGHRGLHNNFKLDVDDIQAIQALYGEKKKKPSQGKESALELGKKPNLCVDPKFDAITTLNDGFIYIFKNEFFFRLDSLYGKISNGYPRLINETFIGLPSNLDAILTIQNITYFFKGSLYWQSNGTTMEDGFPKKIKERFHNIPNNLQAACIWSVNGGIYFFKGKKYWRFSENSENAESYPRDIFEHWPGLPNNIGTCFLAPNNRTYFFKNKKYWKFHMEFSESEAVDYPRLIKEWWFQCPNR